MSNVVVEALSYIKMRLYEYQIDPSSSEILFSRDTIDNQEHDAKNRLSIPVPSSEKLMAEVIRLKKN